MDKEAIIPHLIEIRTRLIRSMLAVLIVFIVLVPWAGTIYDILAKPMIVSLPNGAKMIATGVVTPFLIPVKVTLILAFLLALPYVLYQAWAFITPGLYRHEQRLLVPVVVASILLFLTGMLFCYFVIFNTVFQFVAGFAPESISIAPDIGEYLSFVVVMFLSFGFAFEAPVLVVLLVWSRAVSIETLQASRPYVIVGAFIMGAILAPPDVLSQFLLAIPTWLLYEFGIFCSRFLPQRVKDEQPEGG